jgi:hypothetical protein
VLRVDAEYRLSGGEGKGEERAVRVPDEEEIMRSVQSQLAQIDGNVSWIKRAFNDGPTAVPVTL